MAKDDLDFPVEFSDKKPEKSVKKTAKPKTVKKQATKTKPKTVKKLPKKISRKKKGKQKTSKTKHKIVKTKKLKKSVKKKSAKLKKKPVKTKKAETVKKVSKKITSKKNNLKKYPTLKFYSERDIASDFATKVYEKFNKIIKSVILFGSSTKNNAISTSDIDIVVLIDDATIKWDPELIAWYREELGKLIQQNPYKKNLHINTVKITTWWEDILRGDPVVVNILRYGEALIDFAGFFNPLKALLAQGKIKSTPESIYTALQRAPQHLARSKTAELGSIEGLFWAMVDSAHAALMACGESPPSPEHVPIFLKENFVDKGLLKMRYVSWYRDLYVLHRRIVHGDLTDIKGLEIDDWQERADEFIRTMAELINKIVS